MKTFQQLLENHNLVDLGYLKGEAKHTWHRRGNSDQSSRIDYILTNIPTKGLEMIKPRTENLFTIFDHSYLAAQFGQKIPKIPVSMKDHILGSEEFLITANDHIASLLQIHFNQAPQPHGEQSSAESHFWCGRCVVVL